MTYVKSTFRHPALPKNELGYTVDYYEGSLSTLCAGCGHDSINAAIVEACWEMNIEPHKVAKLSGIGCSSKSPAYFLSNSHGFNSVHGRMPSVATGANLANRDLIYFGVSGDGDTASIGMGQFVHVVRRNLNMIYLVMNNGCYGLTKGQDSATADAGSKNKAGQVNLFEAIVLASLAIELGATFVAQSFSGDKEQLVPILKAAMHHNGFALLNVISPCVTFNNQENAYHSYAWGKDHEAPLHDISYIAPRSEIILEEEMKEGEIREVSMHDGSIIILKNLDKDYNPTDRFEAIRVLAEAQANNWLATGLIYIETDKPSLTDMHNLVDIPLNRLGEADLRPAPEMIEKVNALMF